MWSNKDYIFNCLINMFSIAICSLLIVDTLINLSLKVDVYMIDFASYADHAEYVFHCLATESHHSPNQN